MTKLADMSVTEAASKAVELMIYGEYVEAQQKQYEWREPFTGTFEEYLDQHDIMETHREYYGEDEPFDLDSPKAWEYFKYEGSEGTNGNWSAKRVASYGGEGEGDQYWLVLSVSDGETTRYFRKDGYYASYDGGYLDGDTSEVKPQEKRVIFYE